MKLQGARLIPQVENKAFLTAGVKIQIQIAIGLRVYIGEQEKIQRGGDFQGIVLGNEIQRGRQKGRFILRVCFGLGLCPALCIRSGKNTRIFLCRSGEQGINVNFFTKNRPPQKAHFAWDDLVGYDGINLCGQILSAGFLGGLGGFFGGLGRFLSGLGGLLCRGGIANQTHQAGLVGDGFSIEHQRLRHLRSKIAAHQTAGAAKGISTEADSFCGGGEPQQPIFVGQQTNQTAGIGAAVDQHAAGRQGQGPVSGGIGQAANDAASIFRGDLGRLRPCNHGQGKHRVNGAANDSACVGGAGDAGNCQTVPQHRQLSAGAHGANQTAHVSGVARDRGQRRQPSDGELGVHSHLGAEEAAADDPEAGMIGEHQRNITFAAQASDQRRKNGYGIMFHFGSGKSDVPFCSAIGMGNPFRQQTALHRFLGPAFQNEILDVHFIGQRIKQRAIQLNGAGQLMENQFAPEGCFHTAEGGELERIDGVNEVKTMIFLLAGQESQGHPLVFHRVNIGKVHQILWGAEEQGAVFRLIEQLLGNGTLGKNDSFRGGSQHIFSNQAEIHLHFAAVHGPPGQTHFLGDDFGELNANADGGQLGLQLGQRVFGFFGGRRGFFGGRGGFLGRRGGFFGGRGGFLGGRGGFLGGRGGFLGGRSGFLRWLLPVQNHIGQANPSALADTAPIAFLGGDNFINRNRLTVIGEIQNLIAGARAAANVHAGIAGHDAGGNGLGNRGFRRRGGFLGRHRGFLGRRGGFLSRRGGFLGRRGGFRGGRGGALGRRGGFHGRCSGLLAGNGSGLCG